MLKRIRVQGSEKVQALSKFSASAKQQKLAQVPKLVHTTNDLGIRLTRETTAVRPLQAPCRH